MVATGIKPAKERVKEHRSGLLEGDSIMVAAIRGGLLPVPHEKETLGS